MKKITGLTSEPIQKFTIDNIQFTLTYRPAVQMWFISIEYNDFIVKNIRVCINLNLLNQYKNIIPFGLAVIVPDGVEPMIINDFKTERVRLFLLDEQETQDVEDFFGE